MLRIVLGSSQPQLTSVFLSDVHCGIWFPRIQSSNHCYETTVNCGRDPLHVLLVTSTAQLHGMK